MSMIAVTIGQRIRSYRLQAGLTQEALAEMANVHPTYIGQVERGEKNLTLATLEKILVALNVPFSDAFAHISPSSSSDAIPDMCYELISQMTLTQQQHIYRLLQEADALLRDR